MKTLWNILAVFAVANLLAIAGFVAWLRATDRLNIDRAREVRARLTATLSEEKKSIEDNAKQEAAAKAQAEAEAKAARMPLRAEEVLAARVEITEIDRQRTLRLMQEGQNLRESFAQERDELDKRWKQLQEREAAFQTATQQQSTLAESEQFQKALGVLQTLKPAQAKELLVQTLNGSGRSAGFAPLSAGSAPSSAQSQLTTAQRAAMKSAAEERKTLVIEYLNAMDDRIRTKIMEQLGKDDPGLATELLDGLRRRGQVARVDGAP
jgi:hypothetical protein